MAESITRTKWVSLGNRLVLRSALDYDHPESWWQIWKKEYGEEMPYHACQQIWPDYTEEEYKQFLLKQGVCPTCGRSGKGDEL